MAACGTTKQPVTHACASKQTHKHTRMRAQTNTHTHTHTHTLSSSKTDSFEIIAQTAALRKAIRST